MSTVANWVNTTLGMSAWMLGYLLALVVVLAVVVLLIGIILQAQRILRLANSASGVVDQIDTNTRSVWALTQTNEVAGQILDGAKAIEGNAGAIVGAVASSHGRSAA